MHLSFQLYSARAENLAPLLSDLAALGYREVEGYGGLYKDVGQLRQDLLASGLKMTSGHIALADIEADPKGRLHLAKRIGMDAVFVPAIHPSERPTSLTQWRAFGRRLAQAGEVFWDAGIAFGWHNHDFELEAIGENLFALDLIAGASDRLSLELDLGWLAYAGFDIPSMIARYGATIHSAHIKDIAPPGTLTDEDGWADVGQGVIDWPPVIEALRSVGTSRLVVEHDKPSDARRFARRSIEFLARQGF